MTAKSRQRAGKPATPAAYLASVPHENRAALLQLRNIIKSAVPEADECISYGLPSFRLNGKFLVAYGAATNHCAFYAGSVVQKLKKDLKNYDTSKGTIRFSPKKPIPASLVRKLVKLRIPEQAH